MNAADSEARKSEFEWVSGEPVGYGGWAVGQPDNEDERGEFYVYVMGPTGSVDQPGAWNDVWDTDAVEGVSMHGVVEVEPPVKPQGLEPSNDASGVALPVRLVASAFSDPDGDTHAATQWQVDDDEEFGSREFDTGPDGAVTTQIMVPAGVLSYATRYYWRVRYKDSSGAWSEWSEPLSFVTEPPPPTRVIRLTGELDFGKVAVGETGIRVLTIHNDGNSTLTISSVRWPEGFRGDWSEATVPRGSSKDLWVEFSPTEARLYDGTITLTSDATDGTNAVRCGGHGNRGFLGKIRYVNATNPTPVPPYESWESAALRIQDALDVAEHGDVIAVASGRYAENVVVEKDVRIVGAGPESTVVDGGQQGRVFTIGSNTLVRIESLTIENGRGADGTPEDPGIGETGSEAEPGGGIASWGNLVLSNTVVRSNAAGDGGDGPVGGNGGAGGGIYCPDGALVMYGCVISNNCAGAGGGYGYGGNGDGGAGGGIYARSVLVEDCLIVGNQGGRGRNGLGLPAGHGGNGGGLYCLEGQIRDSIVAWNVTGQGGEDWMHNTMIGDAGCGGGLFCEGSVKVSSTVFATNQTASGVSGTEWKGGAGGDGGGVYIKRGQARFSDCVFAGNRTGSGGDGEDGGGGRGGDGGGLYVAEGASVILEGCLLEGNATGSGGEGISNSWAEAPGGRGGQGGGLLARSGLVSRCIFKNNLTGDGGTVTSDWVDSSASRGGDGGDGGDGGAAWLGDGVVVQSCLVLGNSTGSGGASDENQGGNGGRGGGFYLAGAELHSSTLVGARLGTGGEGTSQGTDGMGGAVWADGGRILNSILWGNDGSDLAGQGFEVGYTDVEEGESEPWFDPATMLQVDPEFVDTQNGDYQLRSTSPCVNAGTNVAWMNGEVDLAGHPRIRDGVVDLGAYEFFVPEPPTITRQPLSRTNVAGSSLWLSVAASGDGPLAYQWLKNDAPLSGATNRVLVLSNIGLSDSGTYVVIVLGPGGQARSAEATLRVVPPVLPGVLTGPVTNRGNGHLYYLLEQSRWVEAEAKAVLLGGHLATVRDPSEQAWIFETFGHYAGVDRHLYIGLHDPDPTQNAIDAFSRQREFEWVSGEPVNFTSWYEGQPDNWLERGEFYVYIASAAWQTGWAGRWNDTWDTDWDTGSATYGVVEVIPPPTVRVEQSDGNSLVAEGQAGDSYTLVLVTKPAAEVKVTMAVPSGQLVVSPTSLSFTVENWNVPQTVSVSAVDDHQVEGVHSARITHLVQSSDSSYDNVAVPDVEVTILDNDRTSGVKWLKWSGFGGKLLGDITNTTRFPFFPDECQIRPYPETPPNVDERYAVQMLAWLVPRETGNYDFYLASDDQGALFLSTDEHPANKVLLAAEPLWAGSRDYNGVYRRGNPPANRSTTLFPDGIPLVAGQRYYLEAIMKEHGGNENLSVAWAKHGDPVPIVPIPQFYLLPYSEPPTLAPGRPHDVRALQSRVATFELQLLAGTPCFLIQWYEVGTGLVASGNDPELHVGPVDLSDNGRQFFAVVFNDSGSATSRVATLLVDPDVVPPRAFGMASLDGRTYDVRFDEPIDAETATNAASYAPVAPGVEVTGVQMWDERSVLLTLNTVVDTLSVDVQGVRDLAGNTIHPTNVNGRVWAQAADIVAHPPLSPKPGASFSDRPGDVEIRVGGAELGGTEDAAHFVYQRVEGDFDVMVHVPRILRPASRPATSDAQAGIVARFGLDADSSSVSVTTRALSPDGSVSAIESAYRPAAGAASRAWSVQSPRLPQDQVWLRLKRTEDTFRAFYGTDGVDWTALGKPLQLQGTPASLLLGLAASSHDTNATVEAEFRDYRTFTYPACSILITVHPQNQTAEQGTRATFVARAEVSGAPQDELAVRWQRSDDRGVSWSDIPGARAEAYTTGFLTQADDGAQLRAVFEVPGCSAVSTPAVIDVAPDATPPTLLAAWGVGMDRVVLIFSEPIDPASADPLHFAIEPGVMIADAVAHSDPTRIDLIVQASTPLTIGANYTLTIAGTGENGGVRDLAQRSLNPDPTVVDFSVHDIGIEDVERIVMLPTDNMLALGSLVERGIDERWVQVGVNLGNGNDLAEGVLRGYEPLTADGQPLVNLVGRPYTVERGAINYRGAQRPGYERQDGRVVGTEFPCEPVEPIENLVGEFLMYLELYPHRIYRLSVNSDDGYRLTPATNADDPNNAIIISEYDGERGAPLEGEDTIFMIAVPQAGLYPMRLIWQQGKSASGVEFWELTAPGVYTLVNGPGGIPAYRPPALPLPALEVSRDGEKVKISWPATAVTYGLVGTDSLQPPVVWTPVRLRPVQAGGRNTLTLAPGQAQAFYKLRRLP